MTRIAAALALTLLVAVCICSPLMARAASGLADGLHGSTQAAPPPGRNEHGDVGAQDILVRMLQAQENLTAFEGTAAARVYVGGRNVLTTSVGVIIERPNHVSVRWLGMTIKPRHGLIFIDPEIFMSQDYALSVLSAPSRSSGDASAQSERWIISAVSSRSGQPQLSWTLHVEPGTWLIRRAQVTVVNSAVQTITTADTAGAPSAAGATSTGETAIIEADYHQAGYRRWEPVRLLAQGRMVLEEFLPAFLVNIVTGRSGRSVSDAVSDSSPRVLLDFGASHPGAPTRGQSK